MSAAPALRAARSRSPSPRAPDAAHPPFIIVTHPDRTRALGVHASSKLLMLMVDDQQQAADDQPSSEAILQARCDYLADLRDALLSVNDNLTSEATAAFQATEVRPVTGVRWRAGIVATLDGLFIAALFVVQQATGTGVQAPSPANIAYLTAVSLTTALGICAASQRLGTPPVVNAYLITLVASVFFAVSLVSGVVWFLYLVLAIRIAALVSAVQFRFINLRLRRACVQFELLQSARHSQRLALSAEIDALLSATRLLLHSGGVLGRQLQGAGGEASLRSFADVVLVTMRALEETLEGDRAALRRAALMLSPASPASDDDAWEAFRMNHARPAMQRQRGARQLVVRQAVVQTRGSLQGAAADSVPSDLPPVLRQGRQRQQPHRRDAGGLIGGEQVDHRHAISDIHLHEMPGMPMGARRAASSGDAGLPLHAGRRVQWLPPDELLDDVQEEHGGPAEARDLTTPSRPEHGRSRRGGSGTGLGQVSSETLLGATLPPRRYASAASRNTYGLAFRSRPRLSPAAAMPSATAHVTVAARTDGLSGGTESVAAGSRTVVMLRTARVPIAPGGDARDLVVAAASDVAALADTRTPEAVTQ